MELAALLVILALAVVAAAFVVRPLREASAREPDERERRLSALRAEEDQTLALLDELDMDYTMGRIEPEDYQASRAARVSHGAALLRQIDDLAAEAPPVDASRALPVAATDIEARVAQLRARAGGFCRNCGGPLVLGDRFCSHCGHPAPALSAADGPGESG